MTTAGGPSSSSLADVIDTILDKGLQGALGAAGEKLGDLLGGGQEEPQRERVSRKSTRGDK
ncbi:MAG: hypothetical protein EOP28_05600 [Rhodococcus sp. (in: high G+C Gram-positive bacteria)]|nr:MAG: hypothetical protein EOP28_05600 [Rhodococcus sp. (in: high G+C Gram-positive bacteria)]